MTGYRLTPRALDGLLRATLHAEHHFGPGIADRVADALQEAFEQLAANPRTGHRREGLTSDPRILFWSVGPALIAYREGHEGIEVLFVERGELDWPRILEADS